jgi:hypothetical protein
MAKTIAELHNTGVENLLRKEEEENVFPKKKDF